LPDVTSGAAGGVFIAGANAATSITTALTANVVGNITGNLSGSVGSVTAGVTLAASAVQAIWDALTAALTTVGSIGKKLSDWVIGTTQTGDSFARLGAPAGASVSADIAAVKVDTAAILVDTGTTLDVRIPAALVGGRMDSSVGAMAANVLTASALATDAANEIADALLDRADAVETGLTLRGVLRLMGAACAGLASGLATATAVYRNAVQDSKARITATVDANGNRTAITWDVS
jgi:hypothetical protein